MYLESYYGSMRITIISQKTKWLAYLPRYSNYTTPKIEFCRSILLTVFEFLVFSYRFSSHGKYKGWADTIYVNTLHNNFCSKKGMGG